MIKKVTIEVENDVGKTLVVELTSDESAYILQYVKDLNALFYYLDYVVKRWIVTKGK
jgi:hypothetical protein